MSAFDSLWESILDVGRDPTSGGYNRFAWASEDLVLREWFVSCAAERGMDVEEDRNGNVWAWWRPLLWPGDPKGAFVTGSHLDSVPGGGAFDGPLGVVSAFAAIDILKARGVKPKTPVGVVAFADEEGARFGVACVGSKLSTGALPPEKALSLRDGDGVTLAEAIKKAGRDPNHVGRDEDLAVKVGVYVELHVEQGRALDLLGRPIGLASAIWPHGRWRFDFCGEANHAGTTRLADRRDPMLAFAAAVLAAREKAAAHDAVATFGKVTVAPNGANAIPSQVRAWLDARAADEGTLLSLVESITAHADRDCGDNGLSVSVHAESVTPVVDFSAEVRAKVQQSLAYLGDVPVLPTAAGHDAGVLSSTVPTAMLFVRNPSGVSHSPLEHAELSDCRVGAEALAAVMADWASW